MSSAICFNLDQSKLLSSGNGLTQIKVECICKEQNKSDSKPENCSF